MDTLAEIETAAARLPAGEKQQLLLFVAAQLRAEGSRVPPPRRFSEERVNAWIAEDERDMERFERGG